MFCNLFHFSELDKLYQSARAFSPILLSIRVSVRALLWPHTNLAQTYVSAWVATLHHVYFLCPPGVDVYRHIWHHAGLWSILDRTVFRKLHGLSFNCREWRRLISWRSSWSLCHWKWWCRTPDTSDQIRLRQGRRPVRVMCSRHALVITRLHADFIVFLPWR